MKKKKPSGNGIRYFIALLICFLALTLPGKMFAQSTCVTATPLIDTICNSGLNSHLQTRWYSFTAHKVNLEVELITDSTAASAYGSMELFSGSCTGLTRIDSSSWESYGRVLSYGGLTLSNTYYLKLTKSDTLNANYALCFLLRTANLGCTNCNTTGCENVCNYSLESNSGNPSNYSEIFKASCWGQPTGPSTGVGTTDYFTTSGGPSVDIPNNDDGSQSAHTGNAYAGIICYRDFTYNDPNFSPSDREYLVGKFACPLVAGVTYNVSFWVSLADNSGYAVSYLGAYLSSAIPYQNYFGPIPSTPQILETSYVTQDAGWQQISGTYTATGGEEYITIGKFIADNSGTFTPHTSANPSSYIHHFSYYYIDDVSVQAIPVRTVTQAPSGVCAPHPVTLVIHPELCGQSSVWSTSQGTVACAGSSNCDSTVFSNPSTSVDSTIFTIVTTIGGTCRDTFRYVFRPNGSSFTISAGNDVSICPGQSVTLTGSTTAAGQLKGWKVASGSSICFSCSTAIVSPTVTTNYVYYATDTTSGCYKTDTVKITVNPLPTIHVVPPAIGGVTTCADSLLFSETASGYFASFSWTTNASGYSGQNTAGLHTHWAGQSTPGYVVVTGTTAEGCTRKDSLPIPSCCKYYDLESTLQPNLVNDSSSHVAATYSTLFSYNSTSQTYTATNKQFSINGTFVVNYKTEFIGCDVKLGPNAKIIIRPGKYLLLDKSSTATTRLYACSDMWDGIYVDGTNSSSYVKVVSGTSIEDAKNAIVSTNGGNFILDGSNGTVKLNKNNIGVWIKPYQSTHPGVIRKTTISCDAPGQPGSTSVTYSGTNCRYPFSGKAFCAIYVDSCTGITIGDSASNSSRNLMERQKYGIYAKNSTVKVWNNDLKYYTATTPSHKNSPVEGVAIYAKGSATLTRTLTVGRIGNYKAHNMIRKCSYGIMAESYMNMNCEYNRIDSISSIGVYSLNNQAGKTILINGDSITEFTGTGINCTNVKQATITITNNQLNETMSSSPTSFGYTAIYVANAANFTFSTVKIQTNTIKRVRNGVWVLNVTRAQIMDNIITFYVGQPMTVTAPAIGIKMEAAHSSLVRNNSISYSDATITTGSALSTKYDKLFGIHVTMCYNDTVTKNVIQKCGSGLYLKGTEIPFLNGCNQFKICYYGVNFGYTNSIPTSVHTSDQIRWVNPYTGTATPTGDSWSSCNNDMKGKINPAINWWCNSSNVPNTSAMFIGSLLGSGNTATSIGTSDQCVALLNPVTPISAAEMRTALLSGICKVQRTYDTLGKQYTYWDSLFAFRTLRSNPSWTSLGTGDDSYYSGWYSAVGSSNIGKMANVEDSIKAGKFSGATSLLNGITTHSTPESNRKTVLGIYLVTWAKDSMNLDSVQTATLTAIANSAPVTGGVGVYDARAMLFLEVHDSSALRLASEVGLEETTTLPGHIYPNPSTGALMLNYELPEGQTGTMQLYDISGRLVHSYTLIGGAQVQHFDARDVPTGLYFYSVYVGNVAILSDKLIIIRQE
jgi:hypothetical protein